MQRYYELADYLFQEDARHPQPIRAVVQKELPNLRHALTLLLEEDLDLATVMADHIIRFLNDFGQLRERDELRQRIDAALAKQQAGSQNELTFAEWLRERGLGEDELGKGDLHAASTRFARLLARIEAQPDEISPGRNSYEHSITLLCLARCLRETGQPAEAEQLLRRALSIIDGLRQAQPENTAYLAQSGTLLSELGDTLLDQGAYAQAQAAYEEALKIAEQVGDVRGQAVDLGQLGRLALQQEAYTTAREYHTRALTRFRALSEPEMEAVAWHNLGMVAEKQQDWNEAERCYRASLAIEEQLGHWRGAADTCNQLASIAEEADRPEEAEGWYKRALELHTRTHPENVDAHTARILHNLAYLLVNEIQAGRADTSRLDEARRYATQVLAIDETLDVSLEIWKELNLLARIAEMEGHEEEARTFRRRERETFAAFAGNRYHIDQQQGKLIAAIVAAARGNNHTREAVEAVFPTLEEHGWDIAKATRRIWAGERDWHELSEGVDRGSALLILRVLETLAQATPTPGKGIFGLLQRSVGTMWRRFGKRAARG